MVMLPRRGRRPDPWAGAHVIITGGSKGIGAAVAETAHAAGSRVSLIARDPKALQEKAAHLGGAAWAAADVGDEHEVTAAIAALESRQGPCDILVCVAGVSLPGRFLEVPTEEFEQQMRVNYLGSVYAVRAVLPGMVARRRGHVILTSSTAGLIGVVGLSGYAATKFALVGLASSLRYEVEPAGVKVSVLFPPDTDTPGFEAENLRKPVECAAVSGTIKVMPATEVARALIDGVRKGRSQITADSMTAALTVAGSTLEPAVRASMTRTIRRAMDR
ncbi:MAG TPA: SDR family oxidoreductase [Phycicoccus sp.]|nr:SDR family oxidoreductase [Phycicoccus sp.]